MKKMQKIHALVLFSLFLALCCNPNEAMKTSSTMPTKTIDERFLEFLEAENTFASAAQMLEISEPDCLIGNKLTNDKVSSFLDCMGVSQDAILVQDKSLFKEYYRRNTPRVYLEMFYDIDINDPQLNDFYELPTKNEVLLSIKRDENNNLYIDFPGEFILLYGSLNTYSCPKSPTYLNPNASGYEYAYAYDDAFAQIRVSVTLKTESGSSYKIPFQPVFALFLHKVFFTYGFMRALFKPHFLQVPPQKIPIPEEKKYLFAYLDSDKVYFTVETTAEAKPFFESDLKPTAEAFFDTE